MDEDLKWYVEKATIRVPRANGLAVVCERGYIVTAARCVNHDWSKLPSSDKPELLELSTHAGRQRALVLAVEPFSGVALLGAPDGETHPEDTFNYLEYINQVQGLEFCGKITAEKEFPVHLLTHEGEWIEGTADPAPCRGMLDVKLNAPIPPGTIGGPIVNDHADLVAIFAQPGVFENDSLYLQAPMPSQCLPAWSLLGFSPEDG